MRKEDKTKPKKKVKKESRKTVLARITKLNRGPLKEKPKTKIIKSPNIFCKIPSSKE